MKVNVYCNVLRVITNIARIRITLVNSAIQIVLTALTNHLIVLPVG